MEDFYFVDFHLTSLGLAKWRLSKNLQCKSPSFFSKCWDLLDLSQEKWLKEPTVAQAALKTLKACQERIVAKTEDINTKQKKLEKLLQKKPKWVVVMNDSKNHDVQNLKALSHIDCRGVIHKYSFSYANNIFFEFILK